MSARLRGCIGGALLAAATAAAAWLNVDHGSARLVLEPGRVGACTTPAATAVEWDAGTAGGGGVRLGIDNLGQPPKLWVLECPGGRAQAGASAHDVYTVTLRTARG